MTNLFQEHGLIASETWIGWSWYMDCFILKYGLVDVTESNNPCFRHINQSSFWSINQSMFLNQAIHISGSTNPYFRINQSMLLSYKNEIFTVLTSLSEFSDSSSMSSSSTCSFLNPSTLRLKSGLTVTLTPGMVVNSSVMASLFFFWGALVSTNPVRSIKYWVSSIKYWVLSIE